MGVFDRAFNLMSENRNANGTSVMSGGFAGLFSGWSAGSTPRKVNYKESLKLPAVYNAVDQISSSLGIIPFQVYEKTKEGRERAVAHPVDRLLTKNPDGENGFLTPYIFKKMTQMSVLLRGNCLWIIKTGASGNQILKYCAWDDVRDIRKTDLDNGDTVLVYITKHGNFLASEVLHFKGFTHDGICGISAIAYGCMQMGVALEIQDFSYTNFEYKGITRGVISSDKVLSGTSGPQYKKDPNGKPITDAAGKYIEIDKNSAKRSIIKGFQNAMEEKNPSRVVVLDEGMTYTPISVTPQEAQLIESARFSIEDIARWFNIAPHKIKSMAQSTNNNIEQQSLDYLSDTMQPWVVNFEEELYKKLLTPSEKEKYYIKGNMNVLLRSDMKSRAEYYGKALAGSSWMTPNEVRSLEETNTLDGGNDLRFPVNIRTQAEIDAAIAANENKGNNNA